jgi:hypothetical protein
MPPAKKSPTRKTSRATGAGSKSALTRREVEQATKRFEKALDEASDALQALGKDVGRGAQSAYKDLAKALKAVRSDAQKTNRSLLKDVEKLAAAVTAGKTTSRSARKRPARATAKPAGRSRRST